MTLEEMQARDRKYAALAASLLPLHPLNYLEMDYIADMLMACAGESEVIIERDEAFRQLKTIAGWLHSTSRIAPLEHAALVGCAKKLSEEEITPLARDIMAKCIRVDGTKGG